MEEDERYQSTMHQRDQELRSNRQYPLKNNYKNEQTGFDFRGARYYDSDVSRFLSLDPLAADYVAWSPYNYVLGNPIRYIDPDGRFVVDPNATGKQRRAIKKAIRSIKRRVRKDRGGVKGALLTFGQIDSKMLKSDLKNGKGPTIKLANLVESNGSFTANTNSTTLNINEGIVDDLSTADRKDKKAATVLVESTILHEYTHYGDDQDGVDYIQGHGEEGQALEEAVYDRDIDNRQDAKNYITDDKAQKQQARQNRKAARKVRRNNNP